MQRLTSEQSSLCVVFSNRHSFYSFILCASTSCLLADWVFEYVVAPRKRCFLASFDLTDRHDIFFFLSWRAFFKDTVLNTACLLSNAFSPLSLPALAYILLCIGRLYDDISTVRPVYVCQWRNHTLPSALHHHHTCVSQVCHPSRF